MIKAIYVDMDGVLADFKKRFIERFKEEPELDYPSKNKEKSAYKGRFATMVDELQFAILDPMPDLEEGLQFLTSIEFDYDIKLLTSTARIELKQTISSQKEQWLKDYDIKYPAIYVPGKILKQTYARPYRLLIDDTLSNVDQWRANGGKAILHTSWRQTIEEFDYYYA
jgi:5'(3')-deoxyribonucleotidase